MWDVIVVPSFEGMAIRIQLLAFFGVLMNFTNLSSMPSARMRSTFAASTVLWAGIGTGNIAGVTGRTGVWATGAEGFFPFVTAVAALKMAFIHDNGSSIDVDSSVVDEGIG